MVYSCVYFIQTTDFIKVGHSSKDPRIREKYLQTGCPTKMAVVCAIELAEEPYAARAVENFIHNYWSDRHHRGEWYSASRWDVVDLLKDNAGPISRFNIPLNRVGFLVNVEMDAVIAGDLLLKVGLKNLEHDELAVLP